MEFRPLTREVLPTLRPYFCAQRFRLSDYTLGFQLMWLPYAKTAYAEVEGCLLIRSAYGGRQVFDYPLHPEGDSEAELRALAALEAWCVENAWPLVLASIPAERLTPLVRRYGRDLTLSNPRTWRDYLYRFSDFVDYAGKRFAGKLEQNALIFEFQHDHPYHFIKGSRPSNYPYFILFYTKHE